MSKQGAASRWTGKRIRYGETMVQDTRWVRTERGMRLKEDECAESDYVQRRKSPQGFHRGARVSR